MMTLPPDTRSRLPQAASRALSDAQNVGDSALTLRHKGECTLSQRCEHTQRYTHRASSEAARTFRSMSTHVGKSTTEPLCTSVVLPPPSRLMA